MAAKPAGALEVGRRVFLCAPSARHRDEFLALMKESRAALRPWVAPPASRAQFTAYLRRARQPTERAFLVCRRQDGAIAGVINVSQIFYGNLRSAYLGYYAGAPFMGKGYMREGLALVLRHAFGTLDLSPPMKFVEHSSSWMNHRWRHERHARPVPGGCEVTDRVSFTPRIPLMAPLLKAIYLAVFRHRHARLRARHGALEPSSKHQG